MHYGEKEKKCLTIWWHLHRGSLNQSETVSHRYDKKQKHFTTKR